MWKYTIRDGATFGDGSIKFPHVVKERNKKLDAHVRPGGLIQVEFVGVNVNESDLVREEVHRIKREKLLRGDKRTSNIEERKIFAEVIPPIENKESTITIPIEVEDSVIVVDEKNSLKRIGGRFGKRGV